jgi:diaminopimelate decarboxylase
METPYFAFKPEVLEKNYREFEALCRKYLKDFKIAYSVKTNSFRGVIDKLSQLGSNFEVASLYEINKTPDIPKVFNSPCKTEEELRIAMENKFLINVDSKDEIDLINKIQDNELFNIGIRISIRESKFGFDEAHLESIIEYCKSKNLNIIGLHFHEGTQQNIRDFRITIQKIEKLAKELLKKGIELKYLDIGGGFPDKIQLKNLSLKLEDYISLVAPLSEISTVILEPGRCLVADCFELVTKVHAIKDLHKQKYAVIDAGINLLPKITLSSYSFKKIEDSEEEKTKEPKKTYILAGPLLFSNDTLGKFEGNLNKGDIFRVGNTGAYCYNLAWEITYPKPEIITE